MRMEGIQGMLNQETAGWIVGMCALVLLIGLGGRYREDWRQWRAGGGGNGRHLLSGSAVYGFGDRASCRDQFVNMLVVGVLGLPGIGLLYAVLAIKTL